VTHPPRRNRRSFQPRLLRAVIVAAALALARATAARAYQQPSRVAAFADFLR